MTKAAESYDAIVIGGGPGGSSAAGFLAKAGLKTVLFEKEKFPRYHIGESLLPATTLGLLEKLGVKERVDAQGFPKKLGGTFLWGKSPEPWTFQFYRTDELSCEPGEAPRYTHSYQVRRAEFDAILLDHARSLGVEVHEQSPLASLEGIEEPVKTAWVDVSRGGRRGFRAPFVVDASGRGSIVRQLFGERRYDPFFRNIAIYGYFDGGKRLPGERAGNMFAVAFRLGWFWYIPLSDTLTSVGLVMGKERYEEMKGAGPETLLSEAIAEAPIISEYLSKAVPCRQAPYDRVRVEVDFSYAHSEFARNGVFLAGDSACFIDPVFSSGVHLATYAGYLAAGAIARVRRGEAGLAEASREYDGLYRAEYMAFYRFLTSFYEMHRDKDSYFWQARKVLGRKEGSDMDAFISIVSGGSTAGGRLFGSYGDFLGGIQHGSRSLETLVSKVSGREVAEADFQDALDFMKPIRESRRRFLDEPEAVK